MLSVEFIWLDVWEKSRGKNELSIRGNSFFVKCFLYPGNRFYLPTSTVLYKNDFKWYSQNMSVQSSAVVLELSGAVAGTTDVWLTPSWRFLGMWPALCLDSLTTCEEVAPFHCLDLGASLTTPITALETYWWNTHQTMGYCGKLKTGWCAWLRGFDEQHEVQLLVSHSWCTPGVNTAVNTTYHFIDDPRWWDRM